MAEKVTKQEFSEKLNFLITYQDRRKYIDNNLNLKNGDYFIVLNQKSKIVGGYALDYDKNLNVWIRYLFSAESGYGKKILDKILDNLKSNFRYARLSCYGGFLRQYYENFGFQVYLEQESQDSNIDEKYYEMIREL